jgi:hypothetical protein
VGERSKRLAYGDLVPIPPRVRQATVAAIGIESLERSAVVELVIQAEVAGAPVRDFAAYLTLVDRLYGRLDRRGLRSYAQRPRDQLKVVETNTGSVELVFVADPNVLSQENIIFLWTLLAGLSSAAIAISHIVKNYAASYNSYEQGRLARAQRKELERGRKSSKEEVSAVRRAMRHFLDQDPRFTSIPNAQRAEIARHLARAYLADKHQIHSVRQFAEERVFGIILRINGRDVSDST